jgi:hypothetical protein
VTFAAEFKLALNCCQRSFRGEMSAAITLPKGLDWLKFLRLVRFHRIEGLAWNALSDVEIPDDVRARLSGAASAIAAQNLEALAECRSLHDRFEAANVPLLFLKGLTLGALAYTNPLIKAAIDVDLLIDSKHLRNAADVLRNAQYDLVAPRHVPDDATLSAWHVSWKESVWGKDSPRLQIDLHTRTADNPRLIPSIGAHSPCQIVAVANEARLPTLADEELFAYLAVHGASSAWFRLKWISDFVGLVHDRSGDEIIHLYQRSQQLGAGRASGQALLLADELFGILKQIPDLRHELERDRAIRRLYRAAVGLLSGDPGEPTDTPWGTFAIHWTQFLLLPGFGYKLFELKRQAGRIRTAGG